ncbi:hypothetical protein [Microbacterium sp. P02]|uniref:hypothetical protein n=1 Tax=Microbacterium sp. P02 TaxID=3366260 RepID=UPI003670F25F
MSRRAQKAAHRAAVSGAGPTTEGPAARFPGATAGFALFGEVVMIGMLVTLVSLPVVTLPAALAAGIRHLRRYLHAEDSRLAFFWRDLRAGLLGSLAVGAGAVVLTLLLLLDIDLAGSGALPGGPAIAAVGWIGLAAVGVTLLAAASAWSPETGWRRAVRGVPAMIAGDVRGALFLVATVGFVVVVTWALPPLIIAALGCAALAAVAIPERPARRG